MKREKNHRNSAEATMNGTGIYNSTINNNVNQCPQPSNQTNMTVAMNCPGYEALSSGSMVSGSCEVSCDSCKNFKNNKCVVNLYDKVLAHVDDSK